MFLPADHPRLAEYQALTRQAEQLGLFEHSRTIGFKRAWDTLIEVRGYRLAGHQLVPLGNADPSADASPAAVDAGCTVQRHRTALTRYNWSAPIQALARFGLLDQQKSVFDYGCGKGDDVRNLQANQIEAAGWYPHFAPEAAKKSAHIVNLGFVINVIESLAERVTALQNAFALAQELLVVSAMLYNQNAFNGQLYQDGVLTQRNTFQKYYTQSELKAFLDTVLAVDSIAIAPGIFLCFRTAQRNNGFCWGGSKAALIYCA